MDNKILNIYLDRLIESAENYKLHRNEEWKGRLNATLKLVQIHLRTNEIMSDDQMGQALRNLKDR